MRAKMEFSQKGRNRGEIKPIGLGMKESQVAARCMGEGMPTPTGRPDGVRTPGRAQN